MRKLKNLFVSETPVRREEANLVGSQPPAPQTRRQIGISGIERRIVQNDQRNQQVIEQSFEDVNVLMGHAKEMVTLSKKITERLRAKGLAEDDTIKFKSYLLSLGVEDPVTKETAGSSQNYFKLLAKEICGIVLDPLKAAGGTMTLPEAYCRVNRARGTQLISPEDLLRAARSFESVGLPIRLHSFPSGVEVIQLTDKSTDDPKTISETYELVKLNGNLDKAQLAQTLGIPVVLANERLLAAETKGFLCRDDTIASMNFYPNRFLGY
ncbi:unnamed protein product [Bursaphelenchus xylophilus]|uniref:Vacuolar protein-sorting-associated protein 36 n=1 Tax=Bursaphelenchus xylophilus TaxID=6326 RepID=A0A1I7S266_BURXY|nr:unnamed protein product [Bursaphelenchus xylophilus]CAG9114862.1 unnamed protein product [Bursaphelenchus xylophilus]